MKNLVWILAAIVTSTFAQGTFPQKNWKQYASVSKAGFSEEKLSAVKTMHEEMKGAALMVVYDGAVVLSAGDLTRKLMDHSMRKSYMSAMYGIYSDQGKISLDKNLAQLGIDDIAPLSAEEKKATISDLLSARSGVYHPSAYSPRGMAERLPERGYHAHGTFWYYNNWDFNTLATIFKQETRKDFFEAFKSDIADPIGMQDFEMDDTFYRFEEGVSKHPAYLFRLSARDQARFGLLYLRNGKWNRKQLVPSAWVSKSTQALTTNLEGFSNRGGYGYLWWTGEFAGEQGYYASGSGGQRIVVIPSRKLVVVQSSDTYDGSKYINDSRIDELINQILLAQDGKTPKKPRLTDFDPPVRTYVDAKVDASLIDTYCRDYDHRLFGTVTITYANQKWTLKTATGNFRLHPTSNTEFIVEDMLYPLVFRQAEVEEDRGKIKAELASDRSMVRVICEY